MDFSYHIVLPEELQIDSFDLTVILGNLLDNSLNALKTAKVKLLNIDINYSNGSVLLIERYAVELTNEPVMVYNFQVEDFHTYHVGNDGVWVHNANKYDSDMLGAKGTQVSSKTTWKKGKTERIDIENPAPGKRPGQIHYHDSKNNKYYYDIDNNVFIIKKQACWHQKKCRIY